MNVSRRSRLVTAKNAQKSVMRTCRGVGCLPLKRRFCKIRLESKWKMTFLSHPSGKFPRATENLKMKSVFFPDGMFQTQIRVPFLQSQL